MFFKSFQILVPLRNNQKMGMIANWESKGKLLKESQEDVLSKERVRNR